MKKTILILSLVILLSSFVSADLISEWTLDDTDTIGTDVVDVVSGYNGTYTSLTTSRDDCPSNLGECYLFGASSDITITNSNYWDFSTGPFFINLWYKTNNSDADNILLYNHKSSGGDLLYRRIRTDTSEDNIRVMLFDGTGTNCQFAFGSSVDDGNWKHILLTGKNALNCTDDNLDAWYNGVNQTLSFTNSDTQTSVDTDDPIYLGAQDNGNLNLEGLMDDICIGTEWITPENITYLYNSSAGNPCNVALTLGGGGSPPVSEGLLTINHNLANTSTSIGTGLYLTYNGTITDTTNNFNCSLYNDTNLIETQLDKDLSVNQSFVIDTLNKVENYEFYIECFQGGEVNDTTTTHFYQIDSIKPDLIFTSNFVNNSNQIKDNTLSIDYSFLDENIYAVNVTWYDSAGLQQQNFFIDSLTGSSYSNTTSKLLSDTCTNCSIRFQAWDSHTTEILNYDLQIIDDFTFKYNNILIISDKKLKFDKKKDKYGFIVDKKSELCYVTDNYFIKISNSNYNSHYIDFDNNIWIDELQYTFTEYYEDNKLNKICFYNDKDTEYKTESIGDLNYAEYTYLYNVISQDTLYLSEISDNTENISEGIKMIYLVLLWITITIGGIYMILKGYKEIGILIYFLGFILDLIIMANIYIDFNSNISNSNVGFLISIGLTLLIPAWFLTRTWLGITLTKT